MSKISELSDGGSLQSTDYLIAVRSGGNVKVRANGAVSGTTGQFSTSLNVDGTVTADGLTVDGNAAIAGNQPQLAFEEADTTDLDVYLRVNGGDFLIETRTDAGVKVGDRIRAASNGDISFYEDTGTTPKFFWDASAESLGIGTTSPYTINGGASVDGETSSGFEFIAGNSLTGTVGGEFIGAYLFRNSDASGAPLHYAGMWADAADSFGFMDLHFSAGRDVYEAGSSHMTIKDDGNVGIGTASPTGGKLQIDVGGSLAGVRISGITGSNQDFYAVRNGSSAIQEGPNITLQTATGTTYATTMQLGPTGEQLFFNYNGSAWNERMRITSAGNVGIGAQTVAQKLLVSNGIDTDGGPIGIGLGSVTDSTRKAIFTKNTTSPFELTIQSGAGGTTAPIVFKQTASGEAMRIDSSGNLLVGTTSWTVGGGGTAILSSGRIDRSVNTTAAAVQIYFANPNGVVGQISTSGTTTTYSTSSDARLKENIADAEDASSLVDAIKVRQFDWKADGSHQRYGMVAQELLEVAPEAVSGDPESDDMMGVDYSKLVPMLVKEIQSLRARVAQLEGA